MVLITSIINYYGLLLFLLSRSMMPEAVITFAYASFKHLGCLLCFVAKGEA